MSEETQTIELNTAPALNPTEGTADRFNARMANQPTEVREASPENENNIVPKKEEKQVEKQEKVDKAPEKKSGIPDFTKKAEAPKVDDNDQKALEEELKQHPAIKGEAAKSFAKVRQQREEAIRAFEAYKKETEAKLAELQKQPVRQSDETVLEYKKRIEEMENELGKASIERTPRHKQFVAAEKQELDAAKSYVDGEDHQQSAIETASRLSGQARLKALVDAGMNSETIAVVASNLARIDSIRRERDGFVDNWRTSLQEQELQHKSLQEQQEQKRLQEEERVFKNVFENVAPKLTAYQKVDGYDEWNSGVDQRISEAQRHFSGKSSLEEISEVIARGVGYEAMEKVNSNLQSRLDEAMEELSKLKAATPNGGSSVARTNVDEGGTAASRFDKAMGR